MALYLSYVNVDFKKKKLNFAINLTMFEGII